MQTNRDARVALGNHRYQSTLFPEPIDDYVEEDSAARVIDVLVDRLDVPGLGFKSEPAETSRPGYHPRTMLKIFIYGYMNKVQPSHFVYLAIQVKHCGVSLP